MKNWMQALSSYHESMRRAHPGDHLMLVFDIDGTILDMRGMLLNVLQAYDRNHGTRFFYNLTLEDITVHESELRDLLDHLRVKPGDQDHVMAWYHQQCWSTKAILKSHLPYQGVLEVIRWFQLQPNTFVGLNSARSERIRFETLQSLNDLGRAFRVKFKDEDLYLNRSGWGEAVIESKIAGLRHFQSRGYRVISMLDNEPDNLRAIARDPHCKGIMLLHADTLFRSRPSDIPKGAVKGSTYDLAHLMHQRELPKPVQFIKKNMNSSVRWQHADTSDFPWGQADVVEDPRTGKFVLRQIAFSQLPPQKDEYPEPLDSLLEHLLDGDRGALLNLVEGGESLEELLRLLTKRQIPAEKLAFNAELCTLHESGFRLLSRTFPGAVIQCPVDFLGALAAPLPDQVKTILERLKNWGVNRFSVNWSGPYSRRLLEQLDDWGYAISIEAIPDLQAFLQAILLLPAGIVSDFQFPIPVENRRPENVELLRSA